MVRIKLGERWKETMVCTQNTARRHKRGVFNRSDRNFGHAQSYRAIEKVKNQRPMLLSAAVVGVRKARVGGGGRGPLGFWESATVSWSRASVRTSKETPGDNKKVVFAKKTWSTDVDICSVFQREWNKHRPHAPGKVRGVQPSADRHHP